MREIPDGPDEVEECKPIDLEAYRTFVFQSPAYKWLLEQLLGEAYLDSSEADVLKGIRQEIGSALPTPRSVSRRVCSEPYQIRLEMDWDPKSFIKEQKYEEPAAEAVERAITITGSSTNAQALTCSQYLCQTWPSSGNYTSQLIKDLLSSGAGILVKRKLSFYGVKRAPDESHRNVTRQSNTHRAPLWIKMRLLCSRAERPCN